MKNKKNYFFGKYYKFVSNTGFTLALIDADTVNGKVIQLITENNTYIIKDVNQLSILDNLIDFHIMQEDLILTGYLSIGELHHLNKDVMSILRKLKMECKHNIYSMYHNVGGKVNINGKLHSFFGGCGYIEGDEGCNFPKKYIWFNSISHDYGLTLAIADIPLCKVFRFRGCFLTLKYEDHEFVFSSLNGLHIEKISKYLLILRKGRYLFKLYLDDGSSSKLFAPRNGKMAYFIHEAIKVLCGFELFYKSTLIFCRYDVSGSLERVDL